MFYFSQIAGNIANGNGISFDGNSITNGFQPLFLFCLVPFGKLLLNQPETSLRIVLLIVSFFTIITGVQLKQLINEIQPNKWLGIIAMSLFLVHPKILSVTFNGTEAALSLLFIVLSLRAIFWTINNKKILLSSLIFTGLILTRFDFSVLFFFLVLFGLIKKATIKNLFIVTTLPSITFLLWLIINYIYFNNIIPGSGIAKQIHSEAIPNSIVNQFLSGYHTALMSESKLSIATLVMVVTGTFFIYKKNLLNLKPIVYFLFIGGSLLLILPILSIGSYRDWYLTPLYLAVILVSSVGVFYFISAKNKYLLLLIPALLWTEANFSKRKMNGYETILACKKTNLLIPKNTIVGSFNSGIISTCLGSKNKVINIDGVVNNNIITYYREKKINQYIKANNIAYILDQKKSIEFFTQYFSEKIKLDLIDTHTYPKGDISLYKVNLQQ